MIKVEHIKVNDFEAAFRGLRNPMDSWNRSDSYFGIGDSRYSLDIANEVAVTYLAEMVESDTPYTTLLEKYTNILYGNGTEELGSNIELNRYIGYADMKLAQRMIGAGTDESKFMRQITVSMDITAPLCFWKEFDTYKVGTVANSCSTMHTLTKKPITRECFSFDDWLGEWDERDPYVDFLISEIITQAEWLRQKYIETNDKNYWRLLIEILPDGWMQKRTVTLNYQVLRNTYFARRFHKQQWWRDFCSIILTLPYGRELIAYEKEKGIGYLCLGDG